MARDPLAVIPSSMSLVIGVLDRAFGFWSLPEAVRKRWLDRMYKAWVLLLQKFHEDWTTGAIDQQPRLHRALRPHDGGLRGHDGRDVPLPRPRDDARSCARPSPSSGEKQRKYESEHKYDLEKFGLTEEQIRRDCAFFYDTFLPPLASSRAEAAKQA